MIFAHFCTIFHIGYYDSIKLTKKKMKRASGIIPWRLFLWRNINADETQEALRVSGMSEFDG